MRRILIAFFGIITLGVGAALLRYAALGSDPFNTMVFGIAGYFSISFTAAFAIVSTLLLVLVLVLKRSLLGLASFLILFGLGPVVELSLALLPPLPDSMPYQLCMLAGGVIAISIGCAFCLQANLGVAPYDGLAPILADRLPIPFQFCRMMTDGFCVVVGMLFGAMPGVGTLIIALGLGPVIALCLRYVAAPLLPVPTRAAAPSPSR